MRNEKQSWFWREIVHTNLTRGVRYAIVLLVVDGALLVADITRLVQGVFQENRGYHYLFISHIVLLGVLVAYLVIYYAARPGNPDTISRHHAAIAVGFGIFFLVYCTAVTLIDQLTHGQITVYVIGCMTLAAGIYLPPSVSVPLFTLNHGALLVGLSLMQTDRVALTGHYVNATIVMVLAVIISRLMFDAQRRVFQGISIIHRQQHRLERLAIEDGLTGLYNRRYADARLAEELERAQRYKRPFSVAMADIDHFKQVNDNWSHQVGDEVLRQISAIMRAEIRAVDVVARYGGEEFVVLFPETHEPAARQVCEKIRASIAMHEWKSVAEGLAVTISIGVAGSDGLDDTDELIGRADERLYRAKRGGRNRVEPGE